MLWVRFLHIFLFSSSDMIKQAVTFCHLTLTVSKLVVERRTKSLDTKFFAYSIVCMIRYNYIYCKNITDCEGDAYSFDSHPKNYLYPFPRSGKETKRCVEFRYTTRKASKNLLTRTQCLITTLPLPTLLRTVTA